MQLCHSNITSMKSAATQTKCTHSVVGNLALELSSVITQKKCRLFDAHMYIDTFSILHCPGDGLSNLGVQCKCIPG